MLIGLGIAYVVVRPVISTVVPHLVIIEFPVTLILAALVMRKVARRTTKRVHATESTAPLGVRHEQKVRSIPDPESERVRTTLDRWVRTGEGRDEAVRLLARAYAGREDPALVDTVDQTLTRGGVASRRAASLRTLIARLEPPTGA